MKKLFVSRLTKTIYLTDTSTGKKENFTNEAMRAVFEWFMLNHKENEPNEAFEVRFKNYSYVLQMFKESGAESG